MVDALLTEIGLRTGRYTSPHLQRATERINLDNRPITAERYVELYREVEPFVELVDAKNHGRPAAEQVRGAHRRWRSRRSPTRRWRPPSSRSVSAAAGTPRTSSTRTSPSSLPIGLDHAEYLGDDILGIAREKAGIIKPGAVAVLAAQDKAVAEVLIERCVEVGAQVAREGAEFGVREREIAVGGQRLDLQGLSGSYDDVFLPLHGEHQASNAALALAAAEALVGAGPKSAAGPGRGARGVRLGRARPAGWSGSRAGRVSPTVLVDAAHNPARRPGAGRRR